MTDLSYQEAVHLFRRWGFQVEPGPGGNEVTLIVETQDSRTCTVHPVDRLPRIAALSLAARWRNRKVSCCTGLIKGKRLTRVLELQDI